jgi:formyltetrahydrofolate hydrolase
VRHSARSTDEALAAARACQRKGEGLGRLCRRRMVLARAVRSHLDDRVLVHAGRTIVF